MRTKFRIIGGILNHFRISTLINVLGLTIAYASFLIVVMVVDYYYKFDKGYPTADRIYQIDSKQEGAIQYEPYMERPLAEIIFGCSSYIEVGALKESYYYDVTIYDMQLGALSAISYTTFKASDSFPGVFGFNLISGDFTNFNLAGKAIIPQSLKDLFFNDKNPIGQLLVLEGAEKEIVEIVAVYEDLPANSSISNSIIVNIGNENLNNWNIQAYQAYLLLSNSAFLNDVKKNMINTIKDEFDIPYEKAVSISKISNLHERYFDSSNPDENKGNKATIYSLIAIACIIIFVAIANFINFSMAQVPYRIKNINIRKLLGSSNRSLQMEQLGESAFISLVAFILAVVLIWALSGNLSYFIIDVNISLGQNVYLIFLTLGIALLTGILASIYPALYSTSMNLMSAIKGYFAFGSGGNKLRIALISFQYVVAIVLFVVALFVYRQYKFMRDYEVGYNRDQIVTTKLSLDMLEQQERITAELKKCPNIEDVAYSGQNITNANSEWGLKYKGEMIVAYFLPVTANFPFVMDIDIAEGRDFKESDNLSNGVYILNKTAQREYGIGLGENIQNHRREDNASIVGIAEDFNFKPLYFPIQPVALYCFDHNRMWRFPYAYIKLADPSDPTTIDYIRNVLFAIDPYSINTTKVVSLDESIGLLYEREDKYARMITGFCIITVIIVIAGVFGLALLETQYRTKEVAIRKILGAKNGDILRLFSRRYILIALCSFLIASPIAYYVIMQWRNNFAYKAPVNVSIFFVALFAIIIITAITIWGQVYRISHRKPVESL